VRHDQVFQQTDQLRVDVPQLPGRVADQVAPQQQVPEQPARHGRLRGHHVLTQLGDPADVVQDRPGHDQVAVERRLQLGVVGGVPVHQVQAQAGHRQRVLEQAAGERVELPDRGGQALQCRRVPVEQGQHQAAERLVRDVRLGQPLQLDPHCLDVVARVLDERRRVEAVGAVVLGRRSDVVGVDLRPVALALAVVGAELVERALAPVALAGLEPRTVRPDHQRDRPLAVAEPTRVIGLAVPRGPPRPLGQQREEVARLTRRQLAQPHQGWLRPRHGSTIQALATKNTKNHETKTRTGRQRPT
jgi:hypothetical protein